MLLSKVQSKSQSKSPLGNSGFTLVELAVVIALIAILAALALPNYQDSVRKSRRAEAQTAMLEFAGIAERIFTESNDYTGAAAAEPDDTNFYSFTVAAGTTTFTITAEPTEIQEKDRCGTMILDQIGTRTRVHTNPDSTPVDADDDCWGGLVEP